MRVKLKAIKFDTDFRKSELTNYDIFKRSRSFPGELESNEVFLFISKGGNQLVWILNVDRVDVGHADRKGYVDRRLIDTRRWRIEGSSSWNPEMLADYAAEVDLDLVGFKRFREIYAERRAAA
jgi:hypothetical protein